MTRCVTLFSVFPHPATGPAPHHLARLTAELGWTTLHQVWRQVTGQEPPTAVIDHIRTLQNEGPAT